MLPLRLLLGGDVMTGRGVDQVLPHPSEPRLYEPHVHDARDYVWLAEQASGPIDRPVPFDYPWGVALAEAARRAPHVRLVNLETSITRSANPARNKELHYRMHPANAACLADAQLDVCALANNHVLDFGRAGLLETLDVLDEAGIRTAGAGRTLAEAWAPATVALPAGGRVVVFSVATAMSGVPADWAAAPARPGVALLDGLGDEAADALIERIGRVRRAGDLVVVSIHWGGNWGWEAQPAQIRFAHRLVDGGVDVVHGHSSHHPRPIEVYQGRLVLYGCGDLVNDYEGIGGYERYRAELRLLCFATLHASTGALAQLELAPLVARRLRLEHASAEARAWMAATLARISRPFGTSFEEYDEALWVHPHGLRAEPRAP